MSTAPTDYEILLQEAINRAKANAPRATDDLVRYSSRAAEAVAKVTGGTAALELVPINQEEGTTGAYQLQLRKVGSEAPPSDLGVYYVSATGYPVQRWSSRRNWESRPEQPTDEYINASLLEGHFKWMIANAESRLVTLVSFFQQNAYSSPSSAASLE